ncbi:hypothetical protein V5P93_002608 [Actinokineospora auranticolor]|uniref:Uncharacterized protein n=1 Tax=Actinokineospora auranticolor TaxID=155976 RepID=A0A2S6GM92_9PSEU|nr:hypothetical protein [Actinokineospora auranticolor]PPK66362.1 hypothetical protein CLV40_11066 [Actinokineospora auranticolor]
MYENGYRAAEFGSGSVRSVADPVIVDRDDAAEALLGFFLANADVNDHDANDYLVEELCRRLRDARRVPAPAAPPMIECD